MADLSSLSIRISASATDAHNAIDKIINDLTRLNAALNNYSADSQYVQGMNRMASGLRNISSAIRSIDSTKINYVAEAIGNLAKSGTKLAGLSIESTLSKMGSASEQASLKVKTATNEIAKAYGITSKKGLEELTASIQRFYSSAGSDEELRKATKDIEYVVQEYLKLDKVVEETYSNIRQWVSGSNFAMPKGATKELLDDFARIRGTLGLANTASGGIGADTMLSELNSKFGTHYNTEDVIAGLKRLAADLTSVNTLQGQYNTYTRESVIASEEWKAQLDRLYESIGKVRSATSAGVDANGFLTGLGGDPALNAAFIGELNSESQQIANAGRTITNSVEQVKQEVSKLQTQGNPFEGIATGLNSLKGINITAEQFSGVTALANSLGKLTGKNAETANTTLPNLATALNSIASINIGNTAQIMELATAVTKFGSKAGVRAQEVSRFAEGLRALQGIEIPNVDNINALASAVGKFGGKYQTQAIDNMPRIATAFNQLLTSLQNAPRVSAETIRVAEALGQLAANTRGVQGSLNSTRVGITSFGRGLRSLLPTLNRSARSFFSLASAVGTFYARYFLIMRIIRGLGKIANISSELTEVQNIVDVTFGNAANDVQEFADSAIHSFGLAELAAKQFASRYQAMGTAMEITNQQVANSTEFLTNKLAGAPSVYENLGDSMSDMSITLTKLTADYASFYNLDYSDVADDMAAIFTGQTRPLRRYGLDLTNATLKEWALKNGLDADIKSMTQAEKTMLRYQYVMAHSGHIMGDFERTADTWANVTRTIGQQFQKLGKIIGEGLVNRFKPFLISFRNFLDNFISLAENALNAIGKLMGWQIEIETTGVLMEDNMEDYADDLGDAADNAKKLNAQLRGIDELNNLTTSNKNGSGDDDSVLGGINALSQNNYGSRINVKEYESDINSWYEFGKKLRDKIIGGIESINWEELSAKVQEKAKAFSDRLKGLLFPDREGNTLGGEIGSFLAEMMNLGFDWLGTAAAATEVWEAAGHNIADFFTHFFEHFDAASAAEAINNIVQGLYTMIKTAATDFNKPEKRKEIAEKIKTFFEDIDPATWAIAIDVLEIAILSTTVRTLGRVAIDAAVRSGLAAQLAADLGGMVIGIEVGFAVAPLIFPESGSRENFNKEELASGIRDFFTDILPNKEKLKEFCIEWAKDKNILGTLGLALKEHGVISDEGWEWLHNPFEKLTETIEDSADWWYVTIKDTFYSIKYEVGTSIDAIKGNIETKFDNIKQYVTNALGGMANNTKENLEKIKGFFNSGLDNIKTKISNWWNNGVQPWFTKARWNQLGENFKSALTEKWNQFFTWYNNTGFKKWWDGVREKFAKKNWTFSGVQEGLEQAFNNAIASIKNIWNAFANFMNDKLSFKWDEFKVGNKVLIEAGSIDLGKIPTFAQGGYPTVGSLFVAGESGAEMLGTIGGKTAVASNGEITGISDTIRATSSEEIALLRQQNTLLQGILQKEFGITKKDIFKSVRSSASEYTKITGNPAFA